MKPSQRIALVALVQCIIGICCGILAAVSSNLDERNHETGKRTADGLYYGLTVLFSMDTLVGLSASIFGFHSAKNWNCRSAYYHFVFTLYNLFCNMLELSVSVYIIFKFHKTDLLSVQIALITFSTLSFVARMWSLRMSKYWQSVLFQRQALRIDPIDTTLPGSCAADYMHRASLNPARATNNNRAHFISPPL